MNDETVPVATPEVPIIPAAKSQPLSHWLKRLLVCNPFFLASAGLLLYGMYRISGDAHFLTTETRQLTFNFTSLQCYEALLVLTAIVLAHRRIWYDASLLTILENLFLLVPFILISQAALIERSVVGTLCGLALALAALRMETVRRQMRALWPASGFFVSGGVVILVNSLAPIIYRHFHENKFGTKLAAGEAWTTHQIIWLLILPALAALANLLPPPPPASLRLNHRRWFPHALFGCWLLGTAVHFYCLGYVYDFDLSRHLVVPALWVLAWTCVRKLPDFANSPMLRAGAMTLPLPLALAAVDASGSHVFAGLTLLNLAGYIRLAFRKPGNRLALHLAMLSAAALVAGAPVEWLLPRFTGFDRVQLILMAAAAYATLACGISRNPKAGLLGAIVIMLGSAAGLEHIHHGAWWAGQLSFVYFLLHSLRWHDPDHTGAAGVRLSIAGLWALHTFGWAQAGAGVVANAALPALVLAVCCYRRWRLGQWPPLVLPASAATALAATPVNWVINKLQTAPIGVLAMAASFAMLGIGAAVAITKPRWHRPPEPHDP